VCHGVLPLKALQFGSDPAACRGSSSQSLAVLKGKKTGSEARYIYFSVLFSLNGRHSAKPKAGNFCDSNEHNPNKVEFYSAQIPLVQTLFNK
jgi:hypothetical protein